jgi:hypothetical protein
MLDYRGWKMSNKDTGGPAFPSTIIDESLHIPGMTLRDYFAAKAMQALLANPKLANYIEKAGQSWIEESAWDWADAMLKERTK